MKKSYENYNKASAQLLIIQKLNLFAENAGIFSTNEFITADFFS